MDNQLKLDMLIISIHANTKALIAMNENLLATHDLHEDVSMAIEVSNAVMLTLMNMNEEMHNDIQQATNDVNEMRDLIKKI